MVALTAYIHLDAATLATMRTEAEAERARILPAGQSFTHPGGRSTTRIAFDSLMSHIAAIIYAQKLQSGTLVERTIADCSDGPL